MLPPILNQQREEGAILHCLFLGAIVRLALIPDIDIRAIVFVDDFIMWKDRSRCETALLVPDAKSVFKMFALRVIINGFRSIHDLTGLRTWHLSCVTSNMPKPVQAVGG